MPAYEVSNHAGEGAESRHNLIYWRYGDYAGIGPGAHGRLTLDGQRWATDTPKTPAAWLSQVETAGHGERPRERLSAGDQAAEYLLMALRLSEGLDMDRLARLAGTPLRPATVERLQDLGMLRCDGVRITATTSGRAVLNAVIRELMP